LNNAFKKILSQSRILAGAAVLVSVAGCVTSQQLVGKARTPLRPDQVQLFLEPPAKKYQEIAIIDTSSKHSFSLTAEIKSEVVIRRLKEQAAKLGANGLVLQDIADGPVSSVGAGVGTDSEGPRGTISLGVSVSGPMSAKFGRGVAIYLE
jgi:hypothetical protein